MARERTPVVPASMAMTTLTELFAVQLGLTRRVNIAWELIGVHTARREHRRNYQDDADGELEAQFHKLVSAPSCATVAG